MHMLCPIFYKVVKAMVLWRGILQSICYGDSGGWVSRPRTCGQLRPTNDTSQTKNGIAVSYNGFPRTCHHLQLSTDEHPLYFIGTT